MAPRLSVVVATRRGWPDLRPCLETFADEARELGVQLVVGDGSGRSAPSPAELPPGARWLQKPGASVFQLYHLAFLAASGALVAATEDHCRPRRGWLQAILDAADRHPDAAFIGGAIENGSTGTLRDWASFFMTQGLHMAPLDTMPTRFVPNESNVAYHADALAGLSDNGGLGAFLLFHNRSLVERGRLLRFDDRMVVAHLQALPSVETSWIHFHNGRSIGGFRRRQLTRGDWARVMGTFALPWFRTARTVRIVAAKGRHRGTLLASIPWMLWFEYCHAIGSLDGYLRGPGASPNQLH